MLATRVLSLDNFYSPIADTLIYYTTSLKKYKIKIHVTKNCKGHSENNTSYFLFCAFFLILQNFTPTLLDEYIFFYVRSTFVRQSSLT